MIDSIMNLWKTVIDLIETALEYIVWIAQFVAFAAVCSAVLDLIF